MLPFHIARLQALFALLAVPAIAQWTGVKTKQPPLDRQGKLNLSAPAPRAAGGKVPDFSGVWNSIKMPCEGSPLGKIYGCSDVPFGIPVGIMDVTATGSEDGQQGTFSKLPYRPGVEAR